MHSEKLLTAGLLLSLFTVSLPAQTIGQPNFGLKSHETLEITKIELSSERTVFFMEIENRIEGGAFCADRNIFVTDPAGKRYRLESSQGIPACPDSYKFKKIGEKLRFTLTFPPLVKGIGWIDIVEECSENCFAFYGVTLDASLNAALGEALGLAASGKKNSALDKYREMLGTLKPGYDGIKGTLYTAIITLSAETGDQAGSKRWYREMVSSGIPHLQQYVANLNALGIKY